MDYKKRDDIPAAYRWDLEQIFPGDEAFLAAYEAFEKRLPELTSFRGRLLESAQTLEDFLSLKEEMTRQLEQLYMYGHLSHDLDTRAANYQDFFSRVQALVVAYSEAISFFTPEILTHDPDDLKSLLQGDLVLYHHYFDVMLREKDHVLGAAEEALLAGAREMAGAPGQVFALLNNADFIFPVIQDEKGEDLRLTHGNFIRLLQSGDRRVREEAFKGVYSVFESHKNALAGLLQAEVRSHIFFARARKYTSAREASLAQNQIPEAVYDGLIEAVHEALPAMMRYLSLRKKRLGLEEMHMYDLHVPLVSEVEMEFPYDEAQQIIRDAMKPLGKQYGEVLDKAFNEHWVDVFETPGKRSGAYSSGSYDTIPYILLNYQSNMNSLFTLAHELGHSMHSWYTHTHQKPVYGDYGIFLAEIASTLNEALLNQHLLEILPEKEQKLYVLNHYLDAFKGTLFRQTMFAEFERDIHRMVEQGEALTAEGLSARYLALNQKYFGDEVISDAEIALEWSRIPHFYYNFYVFQYATGMSAATTFAKRMLEQEEGALEAYLGFLKAGSSDDPIEVLKQAGIDMLSPQVVREALKVFAEKVEEFERLLA